MYVIWRRRKRDNYAGWNKIGDVRLTPVIVQSRRVDGKPKQEHIACLPSIIETRINNKSAVWFWTAVEEKLTRLTNRIPHEDMAKIRAALDKMVPQPDPEFAKKHKDESDAFFAQTVAMFSRTEWDKKADKMMHTFSSSFRTAQTCADCGSKLDAVYRERRTFGHGMRGRRWTVGVLCDKCAQGTYRYYRRGPCETCARAVFISHSIPARRVFCSTRCGQAYYRKSRPPSPILREEKKGL